MGCIRFFCFFVCGGGVVAKTDESMAIEEDDSRRESLLTAPAIAASEAERLWEPLYPVRVASNVDKLSRCKEPQSVSFALWLICWLVSFSFVVRIESVIGVGAIRVFFRGGTFNVAIPGSQGGNGEQLLRNPTTIFRSTGSVGVSPVTLEGDAIDEMDDSDVSYTSPNSPGANRIIDIYPSVEHTISECPSLVHAASTKLA
jgi:hypothetical protein